jgi:hypothetical protein
MAKLVPPPIDHELHMNHHKDDALFSAHAVLAALRSSIVSALGNVSASARVSRLGHHCDKAERSRIDPSFWKVLPQVHQPGLLFAFPQPIDTVVLEANQTVEEIALEEWACQPGRAPHR